MKRTRITLWIAAFVIFLATNLSGCSSFLADDFGKEYYDDIPIPLENHNAEIMIREWSFLSGSGAEVYYKENNNEILLGKLLGGDDGFCPFKEGLYSVAFEDSKLIITWCRYPGSEIAWETKIFDLPSR